MLKKLRFKFIAVAMLSLFSVLSIIIATVNILNYQSIVAEADETLSMLTENDGRFPMSGDKLPDQARPDDRRHFQNAELPYESRFFSVLLNQNGEVLSAGMEHIAAVGQTDAESMARTAIASQDNNGFIGNYRYSVKTNDFGTMVVFLDCTRNLSTYKNFLYLSCGISVLGLLTVFVLITILSKRIVRPFAESYEKQKRFITDAGHEIKTPITIIDADAEVLEMEVGENEWLQDIRNQAKRLGALTNDLIYLSRMDEEQPVLTAIDFPLSDVVSETAQSFQSLALTQNISFNADVEPMLTYKGDEKAIRQLVSILLDNAVKYSTAEGIVSLSLKKLNKSIQMTVFNTCEQLSTEDVERMFDRFYRADKSRNSKTGGYGIGLSIAKAIVTAHKGKITASTDDNRSLTVTVNLPI